MSDEDSNVADLMAHRAFVVSRNIQQLLHGLGSQTQGAILADLVSLWLAGHFAANEFGEPADRRPLTALARTETFAQWSKLTLSLVPHSEKEILAKINPAGRA
jgi:steroid 5-alpha reductase family enzyme